MLTSSAIGRRDFTKSQAQKSTFMTAVATTYILMAKEGFKITARFSYPIGIGVAGLLFGWFLLQYRKTVTRNRL